MMNTRIRNAGAAAIAVIGLAGFAVPAAYADSTTTTTTTTTTDTPAPPPPPPARAVIVEPGPGPAEGGGCETRRATQIDEGSGTAVTRSRTDCD